MKTARKFIILVITMALFVPLIGCGLENEIETEVSLGTLGGTPPSSFGISIPENVMDLRSEIASQLALAYERAEMAEAMVTNDSNGEPFIDEQHMLYSWNNVADLTEFYLIEVEIEGFKLTAVTIGRHGFSYIYDCIAGSGMVLEYT